MADPALQARVNADPIYQAALRQFQQDAQQWHAQSNTDPVHHAKVAADDPGFQAILSKFGNAVQQSPLYQELRSQNLQANPGTGQLEARDAPISPQMLALTIGGTLATGGLLSGAGGGPSSTAPTLEGVSAGGSGATSIPSAATSVLPDVGPSIAPASAASEAALPSAASLATAGGTLPDWLKTAKDVGGALQAYSGGRAAGRVAEGAAQQQQARTADELYNSQLNAPGKIASNSVRGDILANARDVAIAAPSDIPVPTISGGLRPSMFSPTTRATGTALTQNAADSAANLRPAVPPTLPDLQSATGTDSFLNTAGLVGSLASAVPKNIWSKILGAF